MTVVATTEALAAACQRLAGHDFVAVDTEFMRESTFWPKLCLIQLAGPEDEFIVDPLARGIDLQPFYQLMADTRVVKVFHAARQDVEIVYIQAKTIPKPLFDTQVAAMVCGFGESISYVNLVKQHVDGNRLRGLAVTGATRSAIMPQLPTVSEAALPGYQAGTWYGVLAPSGVPREVIAKLNVEISRILASSEIRERLATQGAEPAGNTPEQFAAMIKADLNKWAKVVEAANIKLD